MIRNLIKIVLLIQRQKKYNQLLIPNFVQKHYAVFNQKLSPKVYKKITDYYCIGNPLLIEAYSFLQKGTKLTDKERLKATLLGFITPIIDDFTDNNTLSFEKQVELILSPIDFEDNTLEISLVKDALLQIEKVGLQSQENWKKVFHQVLIAQKNSLNQTLENISEQELKTIMDEKSTYSLLLHYEILDIQQDEKIKEMICFKSGLLQLTNDIFDIYKDYQEGIKTLANTCEDFEKMETYFLEETRKFCTMTRSLNYPSKNIEFFNTLIVFVFARGLTALNQYKKVQKQLNCKQLPFEQLERKDFICDMEKPINLWRMYRNMHKIMKK